MTRRIRRKIEKREWVKSFGAVKATRRFMWTVCNGRLARVTVTVLHIPISKQVQEEANFSPAPVRVW